MRLFTKVFTWSLVTIGCAGGQSGDPGSVDGEPSLAPESDCEVSRWLPNEPEPSTHRCKVADDMARLGGAAVAWDCDCAGESLEVEETTCRAALEQACDVDVLAARYCAPPIGTCFPEDEDGKSWLCRCGEESDHPGLEVEHVVSEECHDAAIDACGTTCNGEVGTCVNLSSSSKDFACTCEDPLAMGNSLSSSIGRTGVRVSADRCDVALADACGVSCKSETGSCAYSNGAFTCQCEDESSATVDVSDLPGPEDSETGEACDDALVLSCGSAGVLTECGSANDSWSASCAGRVGGKSAGQAPSETTAFDCNCDNAGDEAASPMTVEVSTCEEAINEACPAAIRPGTDPNGPTLDYGHVCEEDNDCSAGACYVPGTGVNSVCSKRCEVDSDCPEFAQCFEQVGGYCFVRCSEDAECLALSPAIANALHCLKQPVSSESGVCIQASEP